MDANQDRAVQAAFDGYVKLQPLSGRVMPIQTPTSMDLRERRGERLVIVKSIPWEMIADDHCRRQCMINHDQTLEQIASRCGFGASEVICVISGLRYRTFGNGEEEHRILYHMRVLFNRGLLYAAPATPEYER